MQTVTLKIDFRVVSALLMLVILLMLGFWHPWLTTRATKTIAVTGTGTIKSLPDEYQFSPYFQFTATTLEEANSTATKSQTDNVDALKKLGVADKNIQASISSNPDYTKAMAMPYPATGNPDGYVSTLQLTLTISDKDLAAKVQAYLQGTKAQGTLTATPAFSDSRRKDLEAQARTKAIDDAKAKATQTASELGGKVGKVQSVSESSGGVIFPTMGRAVVAEDTSSTGGSGGSMMNGLQTGQQDVSLTLTATFALQ